MGPSCFLPSSSVGKVELGLQDGVEFDKNEFAAYKTWPTFNVHGLNDKGLSINLQNAICKMQSGNYNLQSPIYKLLCAKCNLQSVREYNLQSETCKLQSAYKMQRCKDAKMQGWKMKITKAIIHLKDAMIKTPAECILQNAIDKMQSATSNPTQLQLGSRSWLCFPKEEGPRRNSHRSGQFGTGQVKTGQVKTGQVTTGQVTTGQVRVYQVSVYQVRTGQFWTREVNLGQIKLSQDWST